LQVGFNLACVNSGLSSSSPTAVLQLWALLSKWRAA